MSDDLAAFITYAVDPGFIDYYREFSTMGPMGPYFMSMMTLLENQLHHVMLKSNMTILELYSALAIK